MPLETGSYLSDLNSNNPTPTDGASQGDDHLRLIKSALKNTFPSVAGPVTGSHTELNEAVAAATTGATKLADAGAFFNTNSTDGVTNPAAGEVDVVAGGNAVVKLKSDKSAAFQGAVSSTGPITGPGAIPIGGTMVWWSDTLPDASWGTYAWCDGTEYLRSNSALFAVLGTSQGSGNGSTTANLPDLREAVPVGKSTMGTTTARGLISNFTSAILTTLGQLFGEATHQLTTPELPAHSHTANVNDPGHVHALGGYTASNYYNTGQGGGGGNTMLGAPATSTSSNHLTGLSVTNTNTGGDTAHNNVQPSVICNWIIRTA